MIRLSDEIQSRYDFGALCTRRGLLGSAAELGVDWGDFAGNFLTGWGGLVYYCVDHYAPYRDQQFESRDHVMKGAEAALSRFGGRVHWRRLDCLTWLRQQATASLVFCYVDAGHEYWEVREEIEEARRVVRPGGIVAGHDFCKDHIPIVNAVREHAEIYELTVLLTTDPHSNWSWYYYR